MTAAGLVEPPIEKLADEFIVAMRRVSNELRGLAAGGPGYVEGGRGEPNAADASHPPAPSRP